MSFDGVVPSLVYSEPVSPLLLRGEIVCVELGRTILDHQWMIWEEEIGVG